MHYLLHCSLHHINLMHSVLGLCSITSATLTACVSRSSAEPVTVCSIALTETHSFQTAKATTKMRRAEGFAMLR